MDYTVKTVITPEEVVERISETPFLVVTRLAGAHFNRFEQAVDGLLGGLLTKACDGWKCELGSYRLIYLPAFHTEAGVPLRIGRLQYILLAGLGHPSEFHARKLCGFTGLTLHEAAVAQAEKITFIESPHRSTEEGISLEGTAAIMRCRAEALKSAGHLRCLNEIEFLCSPQARLHLEKGLTVQPPRCRVCTLPTL